MDRYSNRVDCSASGARSPRVQCLSPRCLQFWCYGSQFQFHWCSPGPTTGFRKDRIELPVRTNQIHRAIPDQPVNMQPITTSLVGGILPFWSCDHGALLHYVLHLEPWILLLVWLLIPGAAHSPDHLCGNLDRLDLLSANLWGLQMVVDLLLCQW